MQVSKPSKKGKVVAVKTAAELVTAAEAAEPEFLQKLAAVVSAVGLPIVVASKELEEKCKTMLKKSKKKVEIKLVTDKQERAGTAGLHIAPLKLKDRIEVKSARYEEEMRAGTLPPGGSRYAWVIDVVRVSFVCLSVGQMLEVVDAMEPADDGAEAAATGLEVLRRKNYFAALDATHFRRFGLTVKAELDGGAWHHIGEVQIHHVDIFRYKVEKKELMHAPYEFFRELLAAQLNEVGFSSHSHLVPVYE